MPKAWGFFLFVILGLDPGIQDSNCFLTFKENVRKGIGWSWIPACAGMTYSHLHALRATAPAKVSYNDGDVRSRNYSWSSSGLTRGSRIPLTLREARLTFQTGPGIIPGHPRAGPSPPAPLPRGEGRSGNRFFPLPWGEGRAQPGVRDSRLRGNDIQPSSCVARDSAGQGFVQ